MKKIAIVFTLLVSLSAYAQQNDIPVIEIGTLSTTHVLFTSDLTYVDVSTPDAIAAKVVEASKNTLAIKARKEFDYVTTMSALESNGTLHTFKVCYHPFPEKLLVDTRVNQQVQTSTINTQVRPAVENPAQPNNMDSAKGRSSKGKKDDRSSSADARPVAGANGVVVTTDESSNFGRHDAPTLEEVIRKEQQLFHIGDKNFNLEAYCTNIFVYSDVTYVILNIINNTDIGFEAGNAQFVIESLTKSRNALPTTKEVWAKSSYGSLSCAPRNTSKVGYTIPKLTLLKNECLRVYIYEKSGNRNLILTLTDKDINYAVSPLN